MRTVKEWRGATPDSKIPPRVRLRQYDRGGGKCHKCTRKLSSGVIWHTDHIRALINGGKNRENNLQTLCEWCHVEKTAGDVAEKSVIYKKRLKDTGIDKPKGFWKPEGAKYNWSKGRYET